MKFLKGKKAALFFILFVIILPVFSFAQGEITTTLENPLSADTLFCFLKDMLDVFLTIGVIIAVIFMVYAGFLYVTARGNDTQLGKAKTAFLGAVIGTAIIMGVWVLAKAIVGTINAIRAPAAAIIITACP
ncbi:MAG: hypothetical protein A3D52_00945 [Candidatus Taylorbacteria bacterium RIFCSPHIGHO2_02_FULL_44_36]|uniref:Uncharacterized protein n=1 Tax=Candidatus Taylorbacteria bacterium RIFCSPLOWO2_12_FULL_44_15c TaxID=1802333 RepID=A0A1G2P5Z7_9BACT|nr:MAG: hypothetical protein A3D52_00945 [Candidatus Taylorbacteria bacterium RIFCSPHIGHO2_02_FULL_44_36]OHA37726.1 MAG: hypothetical protein A3I97_03240 [Candidatus Taylorbacteria bacterium RIFCSPLOWO2_02_FULL_44_35]OHA43775.1 MAG: hypothetical protein A3G03_02115 [Candidatus Taylorbacteria bacterium RIFCSPLOWO2_12_FULL_44_15c]